MSNDNGSRPIAEGFPGEDAQVSRDHLEHLLASFVEQRKAENVKRAGRGLPTQPEGIHFHEKDAPLLIATHAICTHLHHLNTTINRLRSELKGDSE